MKNIKFKEISSIATTILTAAGAGYAGLANIWGWPYADKAVSSIAIIVALVSAVLGAFTIKKVSDRKSDSPTDETSSEEPETATEAVTSTAVVGESEVAEATSDSTPAQ